MVQQLGQPGPDGRAGAGQLADLGHGQPQAPPDRRLRERGGCRFS
jgi:hypothetical protein